jgi:glutathione S-transferase
MKEHVEFLEQYLSEHEFFAGDFSFADIQMSFPLIAIQNRLHGKYPQIQAFVQRVRERSAFQRAEQKNLDAESECA